MKKNKPLILITGGCGFIGSNLTRRILARGGKVVVFDNLSRSGAIKNAAWLRDLYGSKFKVIRGDVRNAAALKRAAKKVDIIFHLAAQVAVTTSVTDPRHDFDVNVLGTFNALEAARANGRNPIFVYASTNKVYGEMENIPVIEQKTRYAYKNLKDGFDESQPLDFHSPYGCSKGAADQYVRDYSRIYGLRSVVFRQSAIYGPRQFGIEDQGWMAWFVIACVLGKPISIYGNGKQVRDMLYVDDLLDAYDAAVRNIHRAAGQVYNIGGGARNTVSVWREFGEMLQKLHGKKIPVVHKDWRPGDQKVCVYDISKLKRDFGWSPKISIGEGIEKLYRWVVAHRDLVGK